MFIPRLMRKVLCNHCHYSIRQKYKNSVYLTFDDGPDSIHTPKILDLLAFYKIKATFFVQGNKLIKHEGIGKEIIRRGHILGNHTYSHKILTSISKPRRWHEIELCQNVIEKIQDPKIRLFRPPRGLLSVSDIFYLIRMKYKIILWTIDSQDFLARDVDRLCIRLKEKVNHTEVILLHDDSSLCIDVLINLIPLWLDQGKSFKAFTSV